MVRAASGGAEQWRSSTELLLLIRQGRMHDEIRRWCQGHVAGRDNCQQPASRIVGGAYLEQEVHQSIRPVRFLSLTSP